MNEPTDSEVKPVDIIFNWHKLKVSARDVAVSIGLASEIVNERGSPADIRFEEERVSDLKIKLKQFNC